MIATKQPLIERVGALPNKPGVYIFRNEEGRVIYVGKAASLRNRVRSYFGSPRSMEPKVRALSLEHRRLRLHRHEHGAGGAAPGGDAGQAASARLQRAPEGRQALPVPEDRRAEPVAAGRDHAAHRERRRALLRAVRQRQLGAPDARRREAALPLAALHRGGDRRRGRGPAWTSSSAAASRPAPAPARRRSTTRSIRAGHPLPGRAHGERAAGAAGADGRGVAEHAVRARGDPAGPDSGHRERLGDAGDGVRAADGRGRVRAGALRRRGGGAGAVHPRHEDDRRRPLPARRREGRAGRGGDGRLPQAVLRVGDVRSAHGPAAAGNTGEGGDRGLAIGAARRPREAGDAEARQQAPSGRDGDGERPRGAGGGAAALADRHGQDAAGAGGAPGGAEPAGPAASHRMLRHLRHHGRASGRQHGRLHRRPAAARRVPSLPDQDASRARTTWR